ncbi:IMP dehydrogenase [Labedella phragmitis]|uniref:IMP dehydrogenase n=2 Tax=Labedella TaxID=390250 RepID=A0A3S4DMF3_9MICO|nr:MULTISPECIES: alcohol dehydrogenase catalytic domain-containing protein [Labedella]RWZ46053.1 IMP dehydrogenase [Labedella phragmitis]RWZ54824.1 IMP dehydrogenase [Labedella populi]
MRATYLFGPGDVAVIDAPDPGLVEPTDALVRVLRACVCGSDLHPYHGATPPPGGQPMGHEFVGVVESVGADVATVRSGQVVIAPFMFSCGACDFCLEGLQTSCRIGGIWGRDGIGGAQAEAVRVPLADGTLVPVDVSEDDERIPALLTLSDVYGTGYHAARTGGVLPGSTVAVIGDGAVGLFAALSAARFGAERVILLGHHESRLALGRRWGATDVVPTRGDEAVAAVREMTGGDGVHVVLEAVGHAPAFAQAMAMVRPGGAVSRVGVPQYATGPIGREQFGANVTITGGLAPARRYIPELLPGVLAGDVDAGAVFDAEVPLDDTGEGYRLMGARAALKVLVRP